MILLSPLHRSLPSLKGPHRHFFGLAAATALFLQVGAQTSALAEDANQVIARVNGIDIKAGDLTIAEEDLGSNLPTTGDAKRDYLTRYLSDMQVIAQASEAKKLAEGDDFKRRLAYARNKLLMDKFLQSEGRAAISESALQQLYAELTKEMAGEQEVHARHILLESENDAKAVLDELRKGADFGALAKQKSKDPSSSDGGDLGYFTKDRMVPEFANVAFTLAVGQISDPVKTEFGWHIIKLEDKRDRPIPPFDKVKDQLENLVARKALSAEVAKLRAEAKIERFDPPASAPEAGKAPH
jgi:peptidyl-prolyl cis-trans isomerase C